MTRIEQEKKTVSQMVGDIPPWHEAYERRTLQECLLTDYAYTRLEHCKFGEKKPPAENVLHSLL